MDDQLRQSVGERARALTDFLIATRRDIHAHPELGNQERRTPELIVAALQPMEFEIQEHVGGTGVVAVLRGAHPGRTLALRADMDALPLNEDAERPYRSTVPGVMHACGHDGHVAMALGAARILYDVRDRLHGNVKLLFQPAEETYGGASEMIADGCLTRAPAVDAVFGLHLEPLGAVGELRVRRGPVMASADVIRVVVKGTGGHASEPHACIDPVPPAAQIITNLQTLVTRRFDVKNPVVISITFLQAGAAFNVIPSEVVLGGTVRTVDPAVRADMPARLEQVIRHTAEAFGATAELAYVHGSGVVVNHAGFTDFVRQVIGETRGSDAVIEMEHPVMGAEDFGLYLEHVPGTFAFLGARPAHQEPFPLHHAQFDFDERALPLGVETLVTVALEYLNGAVR
ncbi:MAG TPA: M20 family metallopeptidase [Candidatus Binatia bacterium]